MATKPPVSLAPGDPGDSQGDDVTVKSSAAPKLYWANAGKTDVRIVNPEVRSTPPPPVDPPPPPTGNTMYRPIYGSGIETDSKDNFWVGHGQRVSFRFRSSGGSLTGLAVNQRGGTAGGYSAGNGGQIKATIQGNVNSKPSGTDLGSVTWSPGNSGGDWEHLERHNFPTPIALTAGQLYHVVFTNPASGQNTNYVSLNVLNVISGASKNPRQPAFTDDFALLFDRGAGWKQPGDPVTNPDPATETPVIDLTYADGSHDGNAYFGLIVDYYAIVSGSQQVRQTMKPTADVKVKGAHVRLKRISGSSPLTMTLQGPGGVTLASASVSGSGIPQSPGPTPAGNNHWNGASLAGGRWVGFTFPEVTLVKGQTYYLKVQSPADSTYMAIPIREVSPTEAGGTSWGARAFRDGSGQKSGDGSNWADLYGYAPVDLQFYLDVA